MSEILTPDVIGHLIAVGVGMAMIIVGLVWLFLLRRRP